MRTSLPFAALLLFSACVSPVVALRSEVLVRGAPQGKTFNRWFGATPIPDNYLAHTPSAWKVEINDETQPWMSILPTYESNILPTKILNPTKNVYEVVPFVDEISAVRILGGWDSQYGGCNSSCDIIDSKLNFRWDLLDQRVDPWTYQLKASIDNNGANKTLLLVLDNIPYVLTDGTWKLGPFGQDAPPANYSQFHWFVGEVVKHLQERYGEEIVSHHFRFRVGTEPDGPRYGDETQYYHSYIAAASAIKHYSPLSPVGAGNWLHQDKGYQQDQTFEKDFYTHLHQHESRKKNAPPLVDFIAQSDYVQGKTTPGGRRYPDYIVNGSDAMRQYIDWYLHGLSSSRSSGGRRQTSPTTTTDDESRSSIPMEIHEFSPLYNRAGRTSVEPGSFGVSFYVTMWATALHSGIREVFHWGTNRDKPPAGVQGSELWTGLGWSMAMADVLVGLPVGTLEIPRDLYSSGIYAISSPSSGVTLVTAFNPYRDEKFVLPYFLQHNVNSYYKLDSTNSPYDQLLADADKLGYTQHKDGLPYQINALLNAEGLAWLKQPGVWDKYVGLQNSTFERVTTSMKVGEKLVVPGFTTYLLMA